MVTIDDIELILPSKSKKIEELQGVILHRIKQKYGFKERIIYPSYVLSSFYPEQISVYLHLRKAFDAGL